MHFTIRRNGEKEILKRNQYEEMEFLTFPLFDKEDGIRHLFTTRIGGVSKGIFATMNVSFTRGDSPEAVLENYRRIGNFFGKTPDDFVASIQTHTTNIRRVTKQDMGKGVVRKRDYSDIDGLITNEKGIILSTFYADCVPLFFYDPVKQAIGSSHSGWRGTAGKMGRKTVEAMMREFGSDPKDILAGIGPSICMSCYEVSEDVARVFYEMFPDPFIKNRIVKDNQNGKYQLDLWEANRQILLEAGVQEEHIQVTDLCTCCNPEYLFSHRKSNGQRGNLGAYIMLTE